MKRERNGMKRREFLGGAFGLAAVAVTPGRRRPGSPGEGKIVSRTLGRTGLKIPVLGFGVMNSDSPDLIHRALDEGVTHLDTAHLYLRGNSESAIGRVIEERKDRDKVVIATKMRFNRDRENPVFLLEDAPNQPAATAANLYEQLDISLDRLKTDYIDILYLHSCYSPAMALYEPLMEALVKVKGAGKARFIGVSTHRDEPNVIRAAVDSGIYDVVLTAYNFLLERREAIREAIAYAAEKGVGIVAMKTQGGNDLQQGGKTKIDHSAALKWVMSDPNVTTTIPGMTTFGQLELNLRTMADFNLSADEAKELDRNSRLKDLLFCQNCRSCIPTCRERVEIPNLIRAFMYAEGYGNLSQARTVLDEIPPDKGLGSCCSCPGCTASCPMGIAVGARINALIETGLAGN
jgi:predicted aldo/keto reductase-like oxidoreductase